MLEKVSSYKGGQYVLVVQLDPKAKDFDSMLDHQMFAPME